MRWPLGARPHKRVIRVVTPLSSRKINFSAEMVLMWAKNSSRRLRFSSRSRSLACSDFFSPQAHLSQHLPHPAFDYPYAQPRQPFAQLGFGQVRLLPQPRPQLLLHRGVDPTLPTVALLHRSFLLTCGQLLLADLLDKPPAHAKLQRQIPQASCSRLIPFQKLAPQIIGISFGHFLAARSSPIRNYLIFAI